MRIAVSLAFCWSSIYFWREKLEACVVKASSLLVPLSASNLVQLAIGLVQKEVVIAIKLKLM
jgi:hypothetical protein